MDSAPRPKRRKIALACDQCRARKSKCDGARPVCGECAQRQNQPDACRFKVDIQKTQQDLIGSLRERIRELEEPNTFLPDGRNLDLQSSPDGMLPDSSTRGPVSEPGVRPGLLQPPQQGSEAESRALPSTPTPFPEQTEPEEVTPVDAMGADAGVESKAQLDHDRFYGSSSAVSFMQQVYNTVLGGTPFTGTNGHSGRRFQPFGVSPRHETIGRGKFWALRNLEQLSLLPRQILDRILTCYWNRIHHLYPFVHRPTFMRAYEQLWTSNPSSADLQTPGAGLGGSEEYGPNSIVFHCALNFMLALAVQFMDDMPQVDRRKLEELFAEKGRGQCELDFFDDGSLAVIQALLLMTQYLQSTPLPNRCWNCIGSACRLAQGLGLYEENAQLMESLSPLEVEIRRRVWYGCVTLDAVVSMTFGRPLMLYQYKEVPLPCAVDDEYLDAAGRRQPEDKASWVDFYVHSIRLYAVLADITANMYGGSNGTRLPDTSGGANSSLTIGFSMDFVFEADAAVSRLEEQLPFHLHWEKRRAMQSQVKADGVFEQQSSVLLSRFLHLKTLLYRPALLRYCQLIGAEEASKPASGRTATVPPVSDVLRVTLKGLSIACVESALLLIEQIHLRSTTTATGAWWYNLFYARTAGMVALLAIVCRPLSDAIGWARLADTWVKCKAALSALECFSPSVRRCLRGLEKLYQHVLTSKNSLRPPAAGDSQDFGLKFFNATTREKQFVNQVLDESPGPSVTSNPQDTVDGFSTFEWPSGFELSMLDDIFALDGTSW